MDKNWLQNALQLLYQRYCTITDVLIVKNKFNPADHTQTPTAFTEFTWRAGRVRFSKRFRSQAIEDNLLIVDMGIKFPTPKYLVMVKTTKLELLL